MSDPFPREALAALLRRLPAYARLAWHLAREPTLSPARRGAVLAAVGYLASPIDLMPGIIPVLGQLDDLVVALAALRFALSGLDAERRRAHLAAVGLDESDLADDLRGLGATLAWLTRAGLRTSRRVAAAGLRWGAVAARRASEVTARVARAVGDRRAADRGEGHDSRGGPPVSGTAPR